MEYGRTVVFCAVLFWVTLFGPATWALAPSSDIAVRDLFPLADWQKQFRITDGRDRGKLVPLSLHHAGGAQETWRLDFGDYAGIHLRNDVSGLTMDRLDLIKSRSFIVYEPALPIFAAISDRALALRGRRISRCTISKLAGSSELDE